MTTYRFIFRPSIRLNQKGSINLRVTHQRQSRIIVLPLKIYPNEWDKITDTSICDSINQKLSEFRILIERVISVLDQQGSYSVEDVALRFRCHINGNTLQEFVEVLVKYYKQRNQERTARAYLSTTLRFIHFCKDRVLHLKDITALLVQNFERSLQNEGLTRNTTSFYMRNLRAIYNKAVQMKEIISLDESPFTQVFTGIDKTKKRALNQKDINTLYNANVREDERLKFSRKLFFFGFHACGMSFVDMAYLRKSDIHKGVIHYRRKKTGKLIEVKITESLKKLIDYFYHLNPSSPYLLPIITDPNKDKYLQYESALRLQNKRLKVLGKISDFTHSLSTHVCRHSWASLAKMLNTPLAVISESLGHSDEKTTAIYLASFDRSVLDKVSERVSELVVQTKPQNFPCYNKK